MLTYGWAPLVQIMESLGGDRGWAERFIAEHAAILYYWVGGTRKTRGGVLLVIQPGSRMGFHAALRLIL